MMNVNYLSSTLCGDAKDYAPFQKVLRYLAWAFGDNIAQEDLSKIASDGALDQKEYESSYFKFTHKNVKWNELVSGVTTSTKQTEKKNIPALNARQLREAILRNICKEPSKDSKE